MVTDLGQARDRHQLQQIIAGLSEGVILIEPGQRIVWGNEAALAMHGVESLEDLGATVDAYRRRFRLRYRNNHILKKSDYPLARVIAGETFSDVTVEVCAAGRDERWVHSIRSVTDADGPLLTGNLTGNFSNLGLFLRFSASNQRANSNACIKIP